MYPVLCLCKIYSLIECHYHIIYIIFHYQYVCKTIRNDEPRVVQLNCFQAPMQICTNENIRKYNKIFSATSFFLLLFSLYTYLLNVLF